MTEFIPANLDDVRDAVEYAKGHRQHLEIVAGGTKQGLGRNVTFDGVINLSKMAGIVDYQPEELVMSVRAGTSMDDVQAALDNANQMLAFEPPNMSLALSRGGKSPGTIGGVMAANLSGSRRLTAGAARDFLLGFEAISGRGENFKSGGKVVKNVTGYDLSKLMCGSFGTLAVMDEITLKTLPRPETSCSLIIARDDFSQAVATIASVFATPHEPGAAAILPRVIADKAGIGLNSNFVTVIRLEGISISVRDRVGHLQAKFGGEIVKHALSHPLWQSISAGNLFDDSPRDLWKLSCPPSEAAGIIEAVSDRHDIEYFADWAGGLLWIGGNGHALGSDLRLAIDKCTSGFVHLIRDVGATKDKIEPFQPLAPPIHALHQRVKAAFDPLAVLNFGRMHYGI